MNMLTWASRSVSTTAVRRLLATARSAPRAAASTVRSRPPGRPRVVRFSSQARCSSSRCSGCLVPNSIMRSLAVGAILVGIVSVVAALTLFRRYSGSSAIVSTRSHPDSREALLEASNPEGRFGERSCVASCVDPGSASRFRRGCSSRSRSRCSRWMSAPAACSLRPFRLEAGLPRARA